MTEMIPMSSPDLTAAEREAVLGVLQTPYLSMGHWVLDFERAFTEYTGRAHAIAVSSGTTGLHLCVRAANIGRGDLVITTPFSFVASANVMRGRSPARTVTASMRCMSAPPSRRVQRATYFTLMPRMLSMRPNT